MKYYSIWHQAVSSTQLNDIWMQPWCFQKGVKFPTFLPTQQSWKIRKALAQRHFLATLPESETNIATWKLMIGRFVSFWDGATWQVRTVSFGGCVPKNILQNTVDSFKKLRFLQATSSPLLYSRMAVMVRTPQWVGISGLIELKNQLRSSSETSKTCIYYNIL